MNNRADVRAFSIFLLLVILPQLTFAQESRTAEKKNYVSFKGGVFFPAGDLDGFDSGVYTDAMYNRYFSKYAAVEVGLGLYASETTFSGSAPVIGSYTETDEIVVIPMKANIKGILPFSKGAFYVGAGVGLYFAGADASVTSTGLGSFSINANDTVVGGQLKAGVIFNINEMLFAGFEGEYMATESAEFSDQVFGVPITIETNLNGYNLSGVFGFRF